MFAGNCHTKRLHMTCIDAYTTYLGPLSHNAHTHTGMCLEGLRTSSLGISYRCEWPDVFHHLRHSVGIAAGYPDLVRAVHSWV